MTETREQREQLKALSQELFGASSRYTKLYSYNKVVTEKQEEMVPGENGAPDTVKEIDVPISVANGAKLHSRHHRTTEEVIELLQGLKARRDAYIAVQKDIQEKALAKRKADEQAKKIQEDLGGSALT